MIVGREGIFTTESGLVLNRRDLPVHYRIDELPGLRATGELEPEVDNAIGRRGEIPRRSSRKGKTVGMNGQIVAPGLAALRAAAGELVAAFESTDIRRIDAEPHPDYTGGDLPSRYFHARCLACEADENGITSRNDPRSRGYLMPFTISLRLDDPRVYHAGAAAEIDDEDDTRSDMGGTGVPFRPRNTVKARSTQGFELTTNNPGDADVEPMIYMYGPLKNPVISNETTGAFLRFKRLSIGAGEWVVVDFRRRRVRRLGGADDGSMRKTLDPSSTWWDQYGTGLLPGDNVIRLRGYRVLAGAKLRVNYRPADFG